MFAVDRLILRGISFERSEGTQSFYRKIFLRAKYSDSQPVAEGISDCHTAYAVKIFDENLNLFDTDTIRYLI